MMIRAVNVVALKKSGRPRRRFSGTAPEAQVGLEPTLENPLPGSCRNLSGHRAVSETPRPFGGANHVTPNYWISVSSTKTCFADSTDVLALSTHVPLPITGEIN